MSVADILGLWLLSGLVLYVLGWIASDIVDERLHLERGVCKSKVSSSQYALEAMSLQWHTLFQIHCPWSWKTCVYHRVGNAKIVLKDHAHERGWTLHDCENVTLHEEIARSCFMSRKRFWVIETIKMLGGPLRVILGMVLLIILIPLALVQDLYYKARYE
jgi:hypothetical protein